MNVRLQLRLMIPWLAAHMSCTTCAFKLLHIFQCFTRFCPKLHWCVNTFSKVLICSRMWARTSVIEDTPTQLASAIVGIKVYGTNRLEYAQKWSACMNGFNISKRKIWNLVNYSIHLKHLWNCAENLLGIGLIESFRWFIIFKHWPGWIKAKLMNFKLLQIGSMNQVVLYPFTYPTIFSNFPLFTFLPANPATCAPSECPIKWMSSNVASSSVTKKSINLARWIQSTCSCPASMPTIKHILFYKMNSLMYEKLWVCLDANIDFYLEFF